MRGQHNSNKIACKRGHIYNENNTIFGIRKNGKSYRDCRICSLEASKRYSNKNRDKIHARMRIYDKTRKRDRKEYMKLWEDKNKERRLAYHKEYNDKNKEIKKFKGKFLKRKYYLLNKEKISEKVKEYNKLNCDKKRVYYLNRYKEKHKTDLIFKIITILRARLRSALKSQNVKKNNSAIKLIGCTILELKSHLANQFQEGMTWENYGKWHIDHIKPCASFNLLDEQEQEKCFHFSNLQPLWAIDNLKKWARLNWVVNKENKCEQLLQGQAA